VRWRVLPPQHVLFCSLLLPAEVFMRAVVLSIFLLGCVAGCGGTSFLITPVPTVYKLEEVQAEPGSGAFAGKIALIEVEGMLSDSRGGGLLSLSQGENTLSLFTEELQRAAADSSVKAVVLRVNSPGGTVTSSDAMYEMVQRFKKKTGKPVVASIQEVGASGAYYVSCAADKIVAQPTSVVGSIGVIFESVQFEGTLAKLGIVPEVVKTGTLKDMGSPLRAMKVSERDIMQGMIEEYFGRFIGVVRHNRKITEAPADDLAFYGKPPYVGVYSGRVFSGAQGVELGLIDQTGLLDDAIDLAKTMAHEPNASVVQYKRPYGYSGSIYASGDANQPQAGVTRLQLPGADSMLPGGFYYLWRAGL
jgi:protease-4